MSRLINLIRLFSSHSECTIFNKDHIVVGSLNYSFFGLRNIWRPIDWLAEGFLSLFFLQFLRLTFLLLYALLHFTHFLFPSLFGYFGSRLSSCF